MLSYTGRRNLYGDLTNNGSSTNLTLGDTLMNVADREIITSKNWDFLEKTDIRSTVASQQFYSLPADCEQLIGVTITTGNTNYAPVEITSREEWDILNQTNNITSDVPEFYYIFNKQVGFYPKPSTATSLAYDAQTGNFTLNLVLTGGTSGAKAVILTDTDAGSTGTLTLRMISGVFIDNETITDTSTGSATVNGSLTPYITFIYQKVQKDLTIADYTTGGVQSIANGGTAMVGTGTTWTTAMAGRYIRITDSDSASKGDGLWYEILSVESATALTLARPYGGTAISAGNAAYAIGQVSSLPEEFQELPVYRGAEIYFTTIQPDTNRATLFKTMYAEGLARLSKDRSSKATSMVIDNGYDSYPPQNPNLFYRL